MKWRSFVAATWNTRIMDLIIPRYAMLFASLDGTSTFPISEITTIRFFMLRYACVHLDSSKKPRCYSNLVHQLSSHTSRTNLLQNLAGEILS